MAAKDSRVAKAQREQAAGHMETVIEGLKLGLYQGMKTVIRDNGVQQRHVNIETPVVRSIFEPLNFLAFVVGCLFAHFILNPLFFG